MAIEVEDVVEPIIFLLSSKSQMINGIGLPIGKLLRVCFCSFHLTNDGLFLSLNLDGGFLAT
jgi:hypothetical protein